jgi:phenylacetate-CoA ligase
MIEVLTLEERFPELPEHGRKLLQRLQEHPCAPTYNHRCGDRMDAPARARVRDFELELNAQPPQWSHGETPEWMTEFLERAGRNVPCYREWRVGTTPFADLPTTRRADFSAEPWRFVPDDAPLENLIVYNTSGTTGDRLDIPSHPETVTRYVPLLRAALATRGATLEGGAERVAVMTVCFQKFTFTFASLSSYLGHAGLMKVNLNPDEWKDPAHRAAFLDECNAELYTGDPLAFAELAKLPLKARPKALVSTAMAFSPGLRSALETHFGCPVLNLYSMNESGPIAVEMAGENGAFGLLQHRLYVEILDGAGRPCAPGTRGEITLTGGFNPHLPLLRYRTGDYAALEFRGHTPVLRNLEGRSPVVFRALNGETINNIDVTLALWPLAIPQFNLHQAADASLRLTVRACPADDAALRAALERLFGAGQPLSILRLGDGSVPDGKTMQYTSDYSW